MAGIRPILRHLTALVLFALVAGGNALAQDTPALFYFYSPDWRPGNLNLLAESMEKIIAEEGVGVRFQAFARYEDFVERLEIERPEFLVAPSWFEKVDRLGMDIELLARPVRNGKTSYRKALMTAPEVESLENLSHGSIAATVHTMGPGGDRTVLEVFNLDPTTAKVIPVPKDIDALLALSFGQVDAALVTSAQFEMVTRINPNITKGLQVLAFSPEIDFPGVYATNKASEDMRRGFAHALGRLNKHEAGRHLLEQLGYEELRVKLSVRRMTRSPAEEASKGAGEAGR